MEIVRELVPPRGRQAIYAVYVVAGLLVGAIEAAGGLPWTPAALDVLAYLAVPLAVLAGANVNDGPTLGAVYEPEH